MKNNFEVITTTDKDQRDRLFQDLRKNGNELEKQVVKFSGVEVVPNVDVVSTTDARRIIRKEYRSTFSVAYPRD